MWRKVAAVLAGMISALMVIAGVEYINAIRFPMPSGMDKANAQQMDAFAHNLPPIAFVTVLVAYVLGSFVGGFVVGAITRRRDKTTSFLVGLFLLTAGIVNVFSFWHPVWLIVTSLVVFIPLTLGGHWVAYKMFRARR